jgi:hypothetical protein
VTGVWLLSEGKAGTNYYTNQQDRAPSFSGNKITLGTNLPNAQDQVMIEYRALGIAKVTYTAPSTVGSAQIFARVVDGTEGGADASITISRVNQCSNPGGGPGSPSDPPGGEPDCSTSHPSAVVCNQASYPNAINSSVEECICRQESWGSPCPGDDDGCRSLCEDIVNRNGGNPFDCDHVLTQQERDDLQEATGEVVTVGNASEINNCLKQCGGDPDCMETCREEYHDATVDRCTEDCLQRGDEMSISPSTATMPCGDPSPSLTFSVSGGTPPFVWGATAGTITPNGDGTGATLTPPPNPGSGEPGVAYTRIWVRCTNTGPPCTVQSASPPFPLILQASRESYGCDDNDIGGCISSNVPQVDECYQNPQDQGCGPLVLCASQYEVGSCNGIITHQCDRRTPTMIANGCAPCPTMSGTVVTVTDSNGKVALAEVSAE